MGSIEPVHLTGVGENPFLIQLYAAQAEALVHQESAEQIERDEEHLERVLNEQSEHYYEDRLGWIVSRARRFFWRADYSAAEQEYRLFFNYQHFYGQRLKALRKDYFPVLFEMNWAMVLNNNRKLAREFYNKELLKHLEPVLEERDTDSRVLQRYINHLHAENRLPSAKHPSGETNPQELVKLAKQLVAHNHRELAMVILEFIQLASLLNQLETMRLAEKIANPHISEPHPKTLINNLFILQWLPYFPFPPPVAALMRTFPTSPIGTDLISRPEEIHSLDNNPHRNNDQSPRKRGGKGARK